MIQHFAWRKEQDGNGVPMLVYSTGKGQQAIRIKSMLKHTIQRVTMDGTVNHLQQYDSIEDAMAGANRYIEVWMKDGNMPAI